MLFAFVHVLFTLLPTALNWYIHIYCHVLLALHISCLLLPFVHVPTIYPCHRGLLSLHEWPMRVHAYMSIHSVLIAHMHCSAPFSPMSIIIVYHYYFPHAYFSFVPTVFVSHLCLCLLYAYYHWFSFMPIPFVYYSHDWWANVDSFLW